MNKTVAEIENAYARYIGAYPSMFLRYLTDGVPIDYDALELWAFPLLISFGAGDTASVRILDRVRFDAVNRALYEQYYADGWTGRVSLDSMSTTILGTEFAILDAKGTRYRANGSEIDHWDTRYIMRKTCEGWKHFILTDRSSAMPELEQWAEWLTGLRVS